ncbi:MAG TPA: hypothetical protein VGZ48_11365 [Candidatus Acidoferrales bacterium]|jgi:hypothetical protein|nr:hypothetical protein [Candidatus Acidoferrales bacterium]
MGRTIPTFRQLIEQAAQRWSKFRRALRREDQEHFDRLFNYVRCYTQAATYQCDEDPMQSILLCIALAQEKRLEALERIVLQKENRHANQAHADPGMDFRPLPQPAGNEVVADRAEPEKPSAD